MTAAVRRMISAVGSSNTGFINASASILSSKLLTFFCQFVSSVILARTLQASGRGEYTILVLIPNTLYAFGNMGLTLAISYFAAREPSRGKALSANTLLVTSLMTTVYLVVLLYAYFTGLLPGIAGFISLREVILISLSVFLIFFINYSQSLLIGYNFVTARNVAGLSESLTFVSLTLLLLLFGNLQVDVAFSCWVFALFVNASLSAIFLVKFELLSIRPDMALLKESLKMGMTGLFTSIAGYVMLQSDLYMIQYFQGNAATGIYSVAASLSFLVLSFPQSIGTALFYKISKMEHRDGQDGTYAVLLYSRITFIATICVAVLMMASAPLTIRLFYGDSFKDAIFPFCILALAVSVGGVSFIMGAQLHARGLVWVATSSAVVAAIVNILCNLFLIRKYSILGASISSFISYLLYFIILSRIYCARVKRPMKDLIPGPTDIIIIVKYVEEYLSNLKNRYLMN